MKNIPYEPLTVESINETLEKLDRILRPKALVLNPEVKRQLLEEYPEVEQKVVLIEMDVCPIDTAYLMDRSEAEKYIGGEES